jgi:hypothetical protein
VTPLRLVHDNRGVAGTGPAPLIRSAGKSIGNRRSSGNHRPPWLCAPEVAGFSTPHRDGNKTFASLDGDITIK